MCIMGKCKNKPKSFVNNQLLAKHAKIHDSNPCTKCQKTFGAKRNLVRHLKTVHKETEADDQNISENSNNSQIDLNVNVDVGSAATDPESVDQNISTSVVDLGFDVTSADIDPLLNMSLDDINQAIMTWI